MEDKEIEKKIKDLNIMFTSGEIQERDYKDRIERLKRQADIEEFILTEKAKINQQAKRVDGREAIKDEDIFVGGYDEDFGRVK